MTEKLDLKTDLEIGSDTQSIGVNPITGFQKYRRFVGLNADLHSKQHTITYEEWEVALDGKVYEELYHIKRYILVDIVSPPYPAYTTWKDQLSPAIMPSVNDTLNEMDINVRDHRNNSIMNLLLALIAYLIVAILTPFGVAWAIIFHFFKLPIYFKRFAIGIDQIGNVTCQYMLNFFLIKKDSKFKFGDEDQTVSYVLGINKSCETLTKFGIIICKILNYLDQNHVENAVNIEKNKQ